MVAVEVNIGGPATLDIAGARRGSRWLLPLVFSDDVDLTSVTGATAVLKRPPASDSMSVELAFDVDLTNKASGVVVVEAEKAATVDVDPGDYEWEIEFVSADPQLDGWAPLRGSWPVMDRVVSGGGS